MTNAIFSPNFFIPFWNTFSFCENSHESANLTRKERCYTEPSNNTHFGYQLYQKSVEDDNVLARKSITEISNKNCIFWVNQHRTHYQHAFPYCVTKISHFSPEIGLSSTLYTGTIL